MPNKHPAFNQHSNCCLILCVILTYAGSYPYTIISRDLRWMTPEVTVSPLRWEGNGPASKLTRLLEQLLDSTTGIHLKQTGRRSHISHRPDPAAAEDRVKASVTAPITLNTLYSGSQWPYITSVWSWLDNGPRVLLCVHVSWPRSPRASFKEVFLGEHSNTGRRHRCGLTCTVLWPACSTVFTRTSPLQSLLWRIWSLDSELSLGWSSKPHDNVEESDSCNSPTSCTDTWWLKTPRVHVSVHFLFQTIYEVLMPHLSVLFFNFI